MSTQTSSTKAIQKKKIKKSKIGTILDLSDEDDVKLINSSTDTSCDSSLSIISSSRSDSSESTQRPTKKKLYNNHNSGVSSSSNSNDSTNSDDSDDSDDSSDSSDSSSDSSDDSSKSGSDGSHSNDSSSKSCSDGSDSSSCADGTGYDSADSDKGDKKEMKDKQNIVDNCAICFEELTNLVKLACKHPFCFSCIKGAIIKNGTECPLCRHKIDHKYRDLLFKHPEQLCQNVTKIKTDYIWIYSGKNCGWWYFEPRINDDVEMLYKLHEKGKLDQNNNLITICGYMFAFDFTNMEQQNKQNGALRHIKRFTKSELKEFKKKNQIKGVCGIKII